MKNKKIKPVSFIRIIKYPQGIEFNLPSFDHSLFPLQIEGTKKCEFNHEVYFILVLRKSNILEKVAITQRIQCQQCNDIVDEISEIAIGESKKFYTCKKSGDDFLNVLIMEPDNER